MSKATPFLLPSGREVCRMRGTDWRKSLGGTKSARLSHASMLFCSTSFPLKISLCVVTSELAQNPGSALKCWEFIQRMPPGSIVSLVTRLVAGESRVTWSIWCYQAPKVSFYRTRETGAGTVPPLLYDPRNSTLQNIPLYLLHPNYAISLYFFCNRVFCGFHNPCQVSISKEIQLCNW